MKCITCDFEHTENYCAQCGEKSGSKKITMSSLVADAFSSITNMDKGILFNIKTLILNPRKIATDYIAGKRKEILNPISFLIVSVSIYLIVLAIFKVTKETVAVDKAHIPKLQEAGTSVGLFIRTNLKYFWILTILPLGLALKLIHKQYNYLEHVAISSFIIGQATLIGIISYVVFRFPLIFDPVVYAVILWLLYKIFKTTHDTMGSFLMAIAVMIVFIMQLILILSTIGVFKYYF